MTRKLSAWDLVDEVLTDMSDIQYQIWAKDKIKFRNALIEEIKNYILTEEIEVQHEELYTEEDVAEYEQMLRDQEWDYRHA
jgi:hypothetical protein